MGLFQYLKRMFSYEASVGKGMVAAPRVGGAAMLYPSGSSPLHVATVYRCVDLLANSVANLRLQYMRKKGEIFVEDTNSRLHYLLTVQPDTYLSAFDFWRQVVTYMLLKGNAYIVPVYDTLTMEIARLALVDPSCVAHDTVHDTYTITDMNAGISGTFDEGEVIHLKNYTRDGKIGISTITYAATTLSIANTGNVETLNRFENGGNVRGIISNDTSVRGFGEYQDDQLEETAKDLDGKFRTGQRIVSVPGQVQFSPLSLSSTDMQFLETRKFTVREICRFFGVHPSFVYDDTSNNYKSAEMANVAFLSNTLNPILRKIENELHRKLVAPTLCCKRRFEFDRRDLYACDLDSRVKYQASTIAAGIYTVNEWRRAENKEPIKGGDLVLVSANLKSIDEVANPTTGNEYSNNSEEDETGNKE
nr:MAG TPA_asm: portal protein [Caudoviricetes sp.]